MTEIAALGLRVDGADGVERSASALDHLAKSADSAEKAADRLNKESGKSKKALDDVAKSGEDASGSVSSLAAAASRAGAIIGAAFSVTAIARYADAWSDMTSLVRVNIGAQEDAADVMSRLSDIARMTYSSMEATARSFATNAFTLNALGKSTQQQLDYTEALNNALVVSGAKGQQFEMVQNSLNRAMAEGYLRGTELQNVLNYGSRVAGLLAEELGVNVTELRALAAQGKITGEVIYNALTKNMEAVREEADSMPATIGDAFTLLRNAVLQTVGIFDQQNSISETLATTLIAVADNMREVAVILASATAGWITYQVAVNGVAIALRVAAAAQALFNAAAMANPYVAAASAVVALSVALYGLRNNTIGAGEDAATLGDYFAATWDRVKKETGGLVDYVSVAWKEFKQATGGLVDEVSLAFSWLWEELKISAHVTINDTIGIIVSLDDTIRIVVKAMYEQFKSGFQNIAALAKAFGQGVAAVFRGDFGFDAFRKALTDKVGTPAKNTAKEIRDAWKKNLGKDWLGDAAASVIGFGREISEAAKNSRKLQNDLDELIDSSGLFFGVMEAGGSVVSGTNDELEELSKTLQSLVDKYDKLGAAQRAAAADLAGLQQAVALGLPGAEAAIEAFYESLMVADDALKRATESAKENAAEADPLAQSWQEALNRIDSAFVDLWKSAFNGFKDFADSRKNAFIQLLAELAHRATTQKILVSLGFTGASGGAMAGVAGGGGGASGLGNILSLRTLTSGLQSGLASVGAAAMTGINWIGETGAQALYRLGYQQAASSWSLGASAFANSMVGAGQTVGGWLGMSNLSANAALGLGSLATAGAGWVGGRVGGDLGLALTGKEGSGWGGAGGALIGAYVGSIIPGIGTIIGSALGGLIGGVVDSIFGSSAWNTTRGGIELGFGESGFDPMMWERQTKKGGLFGSTKRRYKYQDLDPELAGAMDEAYTSTLDSVRELYSLLGVSIEDGFLESVRVASLQIGATGKSKQAEEEIQKQIAEWFSSLQEAAVKAVDASLNFETLAVYASSLSAVNEVFNAIGLSAFDLSVESGKAASSLLQLSGGIENLLVATDFYYQNFYSEQERLSRLTDQTASAFEALGLTLPDSRSGFRSLVESIDRTTESGQMLFLQLLNLAPSMHTIASAAEAAEAEISALAEAVEREFSSAMNAIFGSIRSMDDAYKPAALMIDAYRESASALQNLISTYDGSLDATVHLSEAMGVHQRLAYNLVEAYLNANTAVEALFGGLKESIRTSLMEAEELYEYQRSQVHNLTDLLGTLTDPEAILRTSQEIERLVSGMWSRLDEGQRSALGDEFLDYLDRTEALAQDRLAKGLAELESTQSDIYSALTTQMNDVADRMIETAAAMQEAANLQWQSALQFGAYVQQMGAILLNMGHGQEQNA